MVPSNHSFFQYCDSKIRLFSIAPSKVITLNSLCILFGSFLSKVIALPTIAIAIVVALKSESDKITLTFANVFKSEKSDNYCFCNSWKSDNFMGSNTENKPWTNLQNTYNNWSKENKSDNFCYLKVGRAITKWGAIFKCNKNYFAFDSSNNIFVNCSSSPNWSIIVVRPFIQNWKYNLVLIDLYAFLYIII